MAVPDSSAPFTTEAGGSRWPGPVRSIHEYFSRLLGSEAAATGVPPAPTHPLQPGLSNMALAELVRSRFYEDRHWARIRRDVWSARSTLLRVLLFALSVLAIVFLGIAKLDGFAIVGFICTAASTAVAALEGFFNWRSRWIASDAALAEWHALEEALTLYVATNDEDSMEVGRILEFDELRRAAWSELSQTWLTQRRGGPVQT